MKLAEDIRPEGALDLPASDVSERRWGSMRAIRASYPAASISRIEITAPSLVFLLGARQTQAHFQFAGESPADYAGQFGVVHVVLGGTFVVAARWNDTIETMTVVLETDRLEACGRRFLLGTIPRSILYFDPVACAIATDIAQAVPEQGVQGALEYLLHRVIRELERRAEDETEPLKRVEQIALEISRNLPNLYVDGRFMLEGLLEDPGLRRAFIDRFGCSPHGFALRAKVDSAKVLLRETDMSLVDIAGTLGFSDQSHFSRAFKNATMMTPRDFRRRLAGARD